MSILDEIEAAMDFIDDLEKIIKSSLSDKDKVKAIEQLFDERIED